MTGGGESLRAPFPWFGGKRMIAAEVWRRLGNVASYVEPFFGSGAVLLARPDDHAWWDRIETVNDADGFVGNFWRAVRADPAAVAHHADWPVSECDLHARHAWLLGQRESIVSRLEGDPEWCDARVAGWWVWGICAWIGSGWCAGVGPWVVVDGELVRTERNDGVRRKLPHLGSAGQGINRKRPHLGDSGQGHAAAWSARLAETMGALADRLRQVRVCCGDWSRVCGETPTVKLGTCGVFFDPPYATAERNANLYAVDGDVAADARRWAIERGNDPRYRIALCGYRGEHDMPAEWTAVTWKARGGYGSQGNGRGRANAGREVVWFSPHCLGAARRDLFSLAGVAVG